jgi:hypothetical protein
VLVTNWAKAATPFSASYDLEHWDGRPMTPVVNEEGNGKGNQRELTAEVDEDVEIVFVAQDPNPGDSVEILLLDDPGLPDGMTSSGTVCLPRGPVAAPGGKGMCGAEDAGQVEKGAQTPFGMYMPSACSKAKLVLKWTPSLEQVSGCGVVWCGESCSQIGLTAACSLSWPVAVCTP